MLCCKWKVLPGPESKSLSFFKDGIVYVCVVVLDGSGWSLQTQGGDSGVMRIKPVCRCDCDLWVAGRLIFDPIEKFLLRQP